MPRTLADELKEFYEALGQEEQIRRQLEEASVRVEAMRKRVISYIPEGRPYPLPDSRLVVRSGSTLFMGPPEDPTKITLPDLEGGTSSTNTTAFPPTTHRPGTTTPSFPATTTTFPWSPPSPPPSPMTTTGSPLPPVKPEPLPLPG